MEKLLTVNEAAQRVNLSPWTIRLWVSQKKIGVVRLGRALRIPESALVELIQKGFRSADIRNGA